MFAISLAQADPDFYAPLAAVRDRGVEFAPAGVPAGWQRTESGVWTVWQPADTLSDVEEGWKIHVSARLDRAQHVLDRAAGLFCAAGVPFKHLSCSRFFLHAHHKHADRAQAGKFCAAYPRDETTARRVMQALGRELAGEEGPSVLTDRRFGGSSVVHYRYGAFVGRSRVRLDGTRELLVRDGRGNDGPDQRGTSFVAPDGVEDPFVDTTRLADYQPVPEDFTPVLNGYAIERVITPSNGGGTYDAVRTLSAVRTNNRPRQDSIASTNWSSQSCQPGCIRRTSSHTGYDGGPAVN